MKKKTMVSIVASSLLIAPMVLHQVAAADEQTEELAPSTEVVHAPLLKRHRQSVTQVLALVKKGQAQVRHRWIGQQVPIK